MDAPAPEGKFAFPLPFWSIWALSGLDDTCTHLVRADLPYSAHWFKCQSLPETPWQTCPEIMLCQVFGYSLTQSNWQLILTITHIFMGEKTTFQTKNIRGVALLCIFVMLLNVWLRRRQPVSYVCFYIQSVCDITCQVASGKLHVRTFFFNKKNDKLHHNKSFWLGRHPSRVSETLRVPRLHFENCWTRI